MFNINMLSYSIYTDDRLLLFLSAFYLILCFHYVSQKKTWRATVIALDGSPIQQNDYSTIVFGLSAYILYWGWYLITVWHVANPAEISLAVII